MPPARPAGRQAAGDYVTLYGVFADVLRCASMAGMDRWGWLAGWHPTSETWDHEAALMVDGSGCFALFRGRVVFEGGNVKYVVL